MRLFTAGLLALIASPAFAQRATVSRILNNYSYILPGMPNYGIAQGSIFDVFGVNLATTTSDLQSVPLQKNLSGSSVQITVNGVTTQALLYFVSPTQIAAVLPSATPAGTGQLSVTVNGQTGPAAAITVVHSAFGLISLNGVGNGPIAALDIRGQYLGLTNAANPGDVITLWGSGLGPVTGDESIAQLPVNMAGPAEVDIGGFAATVQYAGRSVYPGLDQINVEVPNTSGCRVSVVVRIGDIVSNFGTIPVAQSGRACSEPIVGLSAAQIQALLSKPVINRGLLSFVADSPADAEGQFSRFTNAQFAAKQPLGTISLGNCTAVNFSGPNQGVPNPIKPAPLNAGLSIQFTPPSGSGMNPVAIPYQGGGYSDDTLMPTGSFRGTYSFTGTGGPDVGAFSAQVDWPGGGSGFTFGPLNNATSAIRSQGLTVTWSGLTTSDPGEIIEISGSSMILGAPPVGASFSCTAPLNAGHFTIPPAVLLALPANDNPALGTLSIDVVINHSFTAPGVDFGLLIFDFTGLRAFSYQ